MAILSRQRLESGRLQVSASLKLESIVIVQLCMMGVTRGSSTLDCSFTISLDGGQFKAPDFQILDQSIFDQAEGPTRIAVRVEPLDTKRFRAMHAEYQIFDDGQVQKVSGPDEFAPPIVTESEISRTVFGLLHSAMAVDLTEQARLSLAPSGPDYPGSQPAPSPGDMSFRAPFYSALPPLNIKVLEQVDDIVFVDTPCLANGKISTLTSSIAPQGRVSVVQIASYGAPQVFAVYWLDSIFCGEEAGPAPFLVYFHPTMGQNTAPPNVFYVDQRDRQ